MSLYNHKQLRDMIEYVDFDNTRTLQKEPQWRVDGTYKEAVRSKFGLYSFVYEENSTL